MKKVRHIDIANALKVSRITVTKALKNDPYIALSTRIKVSKKAEELGYLPNYIGRSLSSKRTYTIGLVLPKIDHSFFSKSVEAFYKSANNLGYNIIPTVSFEDGDNEERNIKTLLSMGVDGIIIGISEDANNFKIYDQILKTGVKLLFYDRFPIGYNHVGVFCNDTEAAKNAVKFLISKGHNEICHFTGIQSLNICRDRLTGYKSALKEAGIKVLNRNIITCELNEESGESQFLNFYHKYGAPKAIFAVNDSVAVGIHRAARELNINIPKDMALIGFGDIASSVLISPRLTTVHIPINEMCYEAIRALIAWIEKDEIISENKIFEAGLVLRESV